jgi:ubiquitin-like domain-containing CTD phosphatase 1
MLGVVMPAGKKCLVLDIDYTLFDLNSSAEHPDELARPYLHEFLTACYEFYDIIIWSATNMKWVEVCPADTVGDSSCMLLS